MKRFTLMLAGAGLVAMSAHAGDYAEKFAKMDADSDGVVTEAEFVAYATADGKYTEADATAKFTKIAGDDGELTLEELTAAMADRKKDKDKSSSEY